MSNLGDYQKIVERAKKVGGPKNLLTLNSIGGMVVGSVLVLVGAKIAKIFKDKKNTTTKETDVIYKITAPGESNEGLKFNTGDEFYIWETDGDAILIEKIGDSNNPYFVDKKLLEKISNFS